MTKTTGLAGNEGKTMDFNKLAAELAADRSGARIACPYAVLQAVAHDASQNAFVHAAVRLLTLGGVKGYAYSKHPELSLIQVAAEWTAGRQRLLVTTHVTRLAELLERPHVAALAYSRLLDCIVAVGDALGYDVLDGLRVRYDA